MMPKRLPATLALVLIGVSIAQIARAEIRITVSRYENGAIDVEGQTTPHRTVTLDGKFKTESDGGGYFHFDQKNYKPPYCMSDITAGDEVYSAVIAGCFGEFKIERKTPNTPAPPG
jgi:hypothetical protein